MKKLLTGTTAALLLLSTSFATQASVISIDIENASFEELDPNYDYTNGYINIHHPGYPYNNNVYKWTGSAGHMDTEYFTGVKVDGDHNAWTNGGSIQQTLTSTLEVGVYDFSVWFGDRTDTPFEDSTAQLFAGGTLIGELLATSAEVESGWTLFSESFSVDASHAALGEALTIKLNSGGVQTLWDDVRLSHTAVPEPSALALFGLGLMGLGFSRKARK